MCVFSPSSQGDEAIKRYTALIEAHPDQNTLYNDRAEIYFLLGDYASALADYQTFETNYTPEQVAYTFHRQTIADMVKAGMAVTYHALGEVAQAQALWRDLLMKSAHYGDITWVSREFFWSDAMTLQAEKLIASLQ